jgi:acetyl-CoA C-acetyltransferase
MGEHAARTAAAWRIGRAEQDELAATSHQRLHAAYEAGFFDDLVTPFRGLGRDENLRPDSSAERLARLKPVFGVADPATATMTAGNSTPLSDGAALVLLASQEWAAAHGLEPLAYLADVEVAAVDFVAGPDGLLTAPVFAVPRLLDRNGLKLADVDRYEIHEAFASQVLATLAAWEDEEFCVSRLGLTGALGVVDRERLNVHGSSLAAGHPFAATGGRITATLAKILTDTDGPARGLISICAAGGQGITALLER